MDTPKKRLALETIGDITVVNFVSRKILDEQNIQGIGQELFDLVDKQGLKKILLNFGNVEYMSTAAIGKLITLQKMVSGAGGKLVFCGLDPGIYETFEITRLNKMFTIASDEVNGLAAF